MSALEEFPAGMAGAPVGALLTDMQGVLRGVLCHCGAETALILGQEVSSEQ